MTEHGQPDPTMRHARDQLQRHRPEPDPGKPHRPPTDRGTQRGQRRLWGMHISSGADADKPARPANAEMPQPIDATSPRRVVLSGRTSWHIVQHNHIGTDGPGEPRPAQQNGVVVAGGENTSAGQPTGTWWTVCAWERRRPATWVKGLIPWHDMPEGGQCEQRRFG